MGADLIGYFAKGPKRLPKQAIPAAIAQAQHRLNWLRRARPILESSEPAALLSLLHDCPWISPKQMPRDQANIDLEQLRFEFERLLDSAGDLTNLTGEIVVRQFVKAWPPRYRDAAHVVDPDCPAKLIVFAGERTWGDTPDGAGFQLLTQAGLLGIAPVLGVWVQAAFISISLPTLPKGDSRESTA
jgi:hypothetical protein